MPTFFSTVLLFFTPFYLACVRKVRGGLFAANSSKLIVIFHFLPVIFGVVGIGFYNAELWMGLETYLTNDMRILVAFQSIIAINFMLFFIWTFRNKFKLLDQFSPIKTKILPWYIVPKLPFLIFCFTLFLYSFELLRLPAIPIYETIVNGPIAGAIARGLVIDFQIANGLPGFGYILYFFPVISLTWLYTQYLDRKIKFMFWFYAALYFGFNAIFLSKSAFIPAFMMFMWVRYSKKNILFDYKIMISAILVVGFFFSLLAYESLGDLIVQILRRAFFGQVEGMFLIREFYTAPDIGALLYGVPGKDLLGFYSFDPSVEIINKVFGDSVEGFVNMNSFYIGQGYVMVGNLILILGPLAYAFNIWLIFKLGTFFPRCNTIGILNIIQFFFILTLSINTNFALLLFFRPILGFLILSIFFELMCILSQTYKTKSLSQANFPIVPQT